MGWSDIDAVRKELETVLTAYDWNRARQISDALIEKTRQEAEPCPADGALAILGALRRKRRFDLLSDVAEAFVLSGQDAPAIRQHYAQSLIDRGLLVAAEPILQALTSELSPDGRQVADAHGSLGRLFKQRYVNMGRRGNRYADVFFERALAEYLQTYRLDPKNNTWQGINVVALLRRGEADGIPVRNAPAADDMAREILDTLGGVAGEPSSFALATRLEALVALGQFEAAQDAALEFSRHPATDAFEVGAALRQMVEVWRLTDGEPPGSTILPILRAAQVRAEHGSLQAAPAAVDKEIEKVQEARSQLEKVFGTDKTVTLKWYEMGLTRTRSVARVERLNGKGHGTGWLVNASDFFPGRQGVLLLTNAHVVNAGGTGGALTPDQAQANFQGLGKIFEFEDEIVWSSPPDQLDATFLAFKNETPAAEPMPLSPRKVRLGVPPPRVYIIGHPEGRDIELSLHDNKLLGCSERLVHYRTPTEPGSSGSPVFEDTAWRVVALHHAGGWYSGLDGNTPPPYEANEGIPVVAIQEATRKSQPSQP